MPMRLQSRLRAGSRLSATMLALALSASCVTFTASATQAAAEVPAPDILDVSYVADGPVDHVKGRAVTRVGTPSYTLDPTLDVYTGTYDGASSADAIDVADAYTGSPNVIEEFTAECVFKWNGDFNPTSTRNVCSGRDVGGFGFFAQNGKKSVTFAAYINDTQVILPYPTEALVPGVWYDAVGTFDGQILRLYLNGALASEKEASPTLTPPRTVYKGEAVTPKWDLGADWTPLDTGPYSDGAPVTIAASRIWSAALSAEEVTALADSNFGDRNSGVAFGETVPAQGDHLTTAVIFDPAIENQGNAFNWAFDLDGASIQPGQYIGGGLAAGDHTITITATDVFGTPILHEIQFTSDDVPTPGSSHGEQADGKVTLSAVATDPSGDDVTVTFRSAHAQVAEGGTQGVVPAVPTSLEFAYSEGSTVAGTMFPDSETFDSPSTKDIPFQRFDVIASGTESSRRVTWSGFVDPARSVSLRVWNVEVGTWDEVDVARGATEGNTELAGQVGPQHVDGSSSPSVIHVLVLAEDPFADDLSDRTPAAAEDKDHFDTPTDDPEDGTPGKYQFSVVHWTDPQYIAAGAAPTHDPDVDGLSLPGVGALTKWPHVEGATQSLDEAAVWAAAYEGALDWTVANAESKRIAWAAMTGDIAQNYNYDNKATDGSGNPLYPGAAAQFQAELGYAEKAFSVMDQAKIPYQVVAGNHDNLSGEDDVPFAETFSAADFYNKADDWGTEWVSGVSYHTMDEDPEVTGVPSGTGPDGQGVNSENSYELFSAGGLDFVSVGLAYGVTDDEAEWASKVFAKYHDRNGILITHGYLAASSAPDGRGAPFHSDGSALYNEVVVPNPNVFLVLAGHVHGVAVNVKPDVGLTVDTKHRVVEMLADYQNYSMPSDRVFTAERCQQLQIPCRWGEVDGQQAIDVDGNGQYDHYATDELTFGASFLRLLQFNTQQSTMSVDTYSPFFDEYGNYPNDDQKRYNAAADNFTVPVDLTTRKTSFGTDYLVVSTPTDTVIGEPVTVPSGAVASVEWTRLVPGELYSWTATATGGAEFGGVFVATEAGTGPGWQPPVLDLPEDVTIEEGHPFDPMEGVRATDDLDGDLTSSVVVIGWPGGTPQPGTYELTYSVADSWGNQTQANRTVTVSQAAVPPSVATEVAAADATMRRGEPLFLSARVTPENAAGTVTFSMLDSEEELLCAATVVNGQATCEVSGVMLGPGSYQGVVRFEGHGGFEGSQGTFTIKVTAPAEADFEFERIAGDTRFDTSAAIAAEYGPSDTAILTSGVNGHYPDALSANYLAGHLAAPILLTGQATTPKVILNQLEKSGVEHVYIVGGPVAVSTGQERALEGEGYTVTRVAGQDRFDTAEAIIAEVGDAPSDTALITTGYDFADALAAGPLTYSAGMPVALSGQGRIRPTMIAALKDAGVDQAVILGGPLAVGKSVQTQLEGGGIDVITRLADRRRSGTSVAIANYAIDNGLLGTEGVNLASGDEAGGGADGLSGAPLSGKQNRPLLITDNATTLSSEANDTTILEFLTERAVTLTDGLIFGGPEAVSSEVEAAAE